VIRNPDLRDFSELLGLSQRLKLLQGLVLDLPDALAGDVERPSHLVQGTRMLAPQAVPELEHSPLPVREVLERLAQRLLGEEVRRPLEWRLGLLIGDELSELGLLLVADRLLERHGGLSGALDLVDLLGVDPGDLGDLLGRWLAAELGDQLALC